MYKLTDNMYERVKATYGEAVANGINDALRNPEGIEDEDNAFVTVSVHLDCNDKIACLDSAIFLLKKEDEVTDLKPPRMLDWYTPKDIFMGHLEEKTVVFLHKDGSSYLGKVDCVDYENESIHLENDAWYWMPNITKIMVLM
jgi:hypothetical protein